tara:strand:+ start:931 stop:1683 length:753 start_codon:yes stop_codon:yes gene_type:complete
MKNKIISIFIFFLSFSLYAEQTEITTTGGIEVFKQEKYYLLKDNVVIISDNFELRADHVKAFFEKDLYDIVQINSKGNVTFISKRGLEGKGEKIDMNLINQDIFIEGKESLLINNNIIMQSDKTIAVNNLSGKFKIDGNSSQLTGEGIFISGSLIEGFFLNIDGINEVQKMYVWDKTEVNIQTETLNMFSLEAKYNKKDDIIELFNKVKVIRDNESVEGDYAKINTLTESYKVTSKNKKKVKILLNESTE